jgi:hypothetical protein
MNTEAELLTIIDRDRLSISYEITGGSAAGESPDRAQPDSRLLDYLQVGGTIYGPDGASESIRLRQTAPGRYEASVDAPLAGNYIVALNPRQGARALAPAIGGASKSTSLEFRRYRSNIGLLDEIAEATGGRRLDIENPKLVNLFDRANMPRSESSLPIWPTILLWTIALMLLDVACRRIAWDVPTLQRAAAAGLARVSPMRLRGRRSAETLSTLRRVSDAFDERQLSGSEGVAKLKGTGRLRPPPERVIRSDGTSTFAADTAAPPASPTPAPDRQQVAAALDALLARDAAADSPTEPPTATPTAPPGASLPPASDTTSGLLAAKRRARQRMDEGGADSPRE